MTVVDSHCHVSPIWYEPVESLIYEMDRNGVEHAILVQMIGQPNNDYQFECEQRFPGRFSSVVFIDTDRPDAAETLARLAERGAVGVRFRSNTRSPGRDPLAIWRLAERLDLPVSCNGVGQDFASDEFAALVRELSGLKFVIEHLGGGNHPSHPSSDHDLDTRRKILSLARFPNTYIKIHGLGEIARRTTPVTEPFPFERPIPPLLDWAFETFGASRMMWGSDFPPVSAREGYGNALRFTRDYFASKSDEERALIFGGTALSVFKRRD